MALVEEGGVWTKWIRLRHCTWGGRPWSARRHRHGWKALTCGPGEDTCLRSLDAPAKHIQRVEGKLFASYTHLIHFLGIPSFCPLFKNRKDSLHKSLRFFLIVCNHFNWNHLKNLANFELKFF
jgi:hypothetical protein